MWLEVYHRKRNFDLVVCVGWPTPKAGSGGVPCSPVAEARDRCRYGRTAFAEARGSDANAPKAVGDRWQGGQAKQGRERTFTPEQRLVSGQLVATRLAGIVTPTHGNRTPRQVKLTSSVKWVRRTLAKHDATEQTRPPHIGNLSR